MSDIEIFIGWLAGTLVEAEHDLTSLYSKEQAIKTVATAIGGFEELLRGVADKTTTVEDVGDLLFSYLEKWHQGEMAGWVTLYQDQK